MHRTRSLTLLTVFTATQFALAQSPPGAPPRAPGEIGPTPTNPTDTGFGTTQGTNPTGSPGPVPTTQPTPYVVPPPLPPMLPPPPPQAGPLGIIPNAPLPPSRVTGIAPPEEAGMLPPELSPRAGGLTSDVAAQRAAATGYLVRAAEAGERAASAGESEALRQMIPQLTGSFRYTRLSPYTVPSFMVGGMNIPIGQAILDQYAFRVSLTVPLTDIPLRFLRFYRANGLIAEARRLDTEAARATAALNGREAYFEYGRALGNQATAEAAAQSIDRRRADVLRAVEAGTLARAELLRVEAQLANSRANATFTRDATEFAAARLRQVLHMRADETIVLGEALEGTISIPGNVVSLIQRAHTTRPELRSLERQAASLGEQAAANWASIFPSIAAVGNFDYANPNSRFFPPTPAFRETWDVNVQLQWSPNTAFVAGATISRINATRDQLFEQMRAMAEGFEIDIRNQLLSAHRAAAAVESSRSQVASAQEDYRISRERFAAGAAVATDLVTAETNLRNARFAIINANIDLRIALARLRRAVGEPEATAQNSPARPAH